MVTLRMGSRAEVRTRPPDFQSNAAENYDA